MCVSDLVVVDEFDKELLLQCRHIVSYNMDVTGNHGRFVFPERGTVAFNKITSSNPSLEKFIRIMRDRPATTVAERADLYRQIVLNQLHEDLELVIEDDKGGDVGPEWLDLEMETSQDNWAVNGECSRLRFDRYKISKAMLKTRALRIQRMNSNFICLLR